jgi:hypothetical protein
MVPVIGSVAMGIFSVLLYWATTRLGRRRPNPPEVGAKPSTQT